MVRPVEINTPRGRRKSLGWAPLIRWARFAQMLVTSAAVFSHRVAWERALNPLSELEGLRRRAGDVIVDLTVSNPTTVGIPYPEALLRQAMGHQAMAAYQPAPRGLDAARAAVAADYAARGIVVAPDNLLLTASSSESYSLLFKLLCDPGDTVLIPRPSYPLFDYLGRLEGVQTVPYRLAYDGVWHIDFASVAEALMQARRVGRPRAIVVVSPNNPTGSFTKTAELRRLASVCAEDDLALISDEVFADYPFDDRGAQNMAGTSGDPEWDGRPVLCAAVSPVARDVLTFSLGGLSKSCGLPQLKLGWVVLGGPNDGVGAAWERLEVIADTYLSVGTPVQLAAAELLTLGGGLRRDIHARVKQNRETLKAALPRAPAVTLLAAEAGWSAILRVPATESDEDWAQTLLRDDGILVHPGYLFDMPHGAFLVVSLLPKPAVFAPAIERVLARCGAMGGT